MTTLPHDPSSVARSPPPLWSRLDWRKFLVLYLATLVAFFGISDNWRRSLIGSGLLAAWFMSINATLQTPRLEAGGQGGQKQLRWRTMQRFGFPTAVMWPLMLLLIFGHVPKEPGGLLVYLVLLVFVGGGWAAMHVTFRETFLLFGDRLERKSPWTGRRTSLAFASVTRVTLDAHKRFVLTSESGQELAISPRIDGIGELAHAVLRSVRGDALDKSEVVRPLLEQVARLWSQSKRAQLDDGE